MSKKIIFIILAIILLVGIGIVLLPKEQKDNISNTVFSKFNDIR